MCNKLKIVTVLSCLLFLVQWGQSQTLTVSTDSLRDCMIRENYNSDTGDVFGVPVNMFTLDTVGSRSAALLKAYLGEITPPVVVDSVLLTGHFSVFDVEIGLARMLTDWIEGNLDNAPVAISGDSGTTWTHAKQYYTGEGTTVAWAAGSFGAGDWEDNSGVYYGKDSAENVAGRPAYFSGDDLEDLVEGWINGTIPNYGVAVVSVDMTVSPFVIYSRESGVPAQWWTLYIEYTPVAASGDYPRRRRILLQ